MNAELVKSESVAREADEPRSLMQVIAKAVMAGTTSVEVMRELLDMQFKVENRQAEVEFNAALARLMPKLPRIEKGGVIFNKGGTTIRSRFAKYEDIDAAIRPLLAEEGFSISFDTDDSTQRMLKVTGTLSHRMGHSRRSQITLPTENAQITGAQAVGSCASFGKRYVVTNLLNIVAVGEDNDGQGEDPKPISEDQALTLRTLMQDTKSDVTKFLAWAGVARVEDILEKNFSSVVKALESKRSARA